MQQPAKEIKDTYIPALTGVRAVAALMVLVGHAANIKVFASVPLLQRWYEPLPSMGMSIFFVLSGFLMWTHYAPQFRLYRFTRASIDFAVARFARLYPLYLFILLFVLLRDSPAELSASFPRNLPFFLLVQSWLPGFHGHMLLMSLNIEHSWSISTEIFCYALVPFFILAFARLRRRGFLALGLACGLALFTIGWFGNIHMVWLQRHVTPSLSLTDANMWLFYYSPLTRAFEFFGGCCAAALYERRGEEKKVSGWATHGWVVLLSVLVAIIIMHAVFYLFPPDSYYQLSAITIIRGMPTLLVAALLYHVARFSSPLSVTLSSAGMIWLGECSYSSYLLHPYILQLFHKLSADVSAASLLYYFLELTVIVTLTIACAYGLYRTVELPCRTWLRRKHSEKKSARSIAAIVIIPVLTMTLIGKMPYSAYPLHDTRIADLQSIRTALETYHRHHGAYPLSLNSQGAVDWIGIGWGGVGENWLPGLTPDYLTKAPRDPRMTDIAHAQYIWNSDGKNYKLISMNPEDCVDTIKKEPGLSDARRNTKESCTAYGYWTPEAANW